MTTEQELEKLNQFKRERLARGEKVSPWTTAFQKAGKEKLARETRPAEIQSDIAMREDQDMTKGVYGDEYRAALGMDVNREDEIRRAGANNMLASLTERQGALMARRAAAAGPQVSPLLLRAQQNQLAQQLAAQRATGGAMGARGAIMAGAGAGGQLATQGVGKMSAEDMANMAMAQSAVGQARGGDLMRAGIGTQAERADDAYNAAKRQQALGYLGMGAKEKQAYQEQMMAMLRATTEMQERPTAPSQWDNVIYGAMNAGAAALPYLGGLSDGGGGGKVDPTAMLNQALMSRPG